MAHARGGRREPLPYQAGHRHVELPGDCDDVLTPAGGVHDRDADCHFPPPYVLRWGMTRYSSIGGSSPAGAAPLVEASSSACTFASVSAEDSATSATALTTSSSRRFISLTPCEARP